MKRETIITTDKQAFQQAVIARCQKLGLRPVAAIGTGLPAAIMGQDAKGYTAVLFVWQPPR